ncbi:MAG: NAD(P)H-binding protein [Acidobacteriota bacterium]
MGGKGDGKHTTLVSDSVKAVIAVMQKQGIRHLICMSNAGAGGSSTWFANRIAIPLFIRWLLPIIEDKDLMESALLESTLDWVSVRLPRIVEGPEKPIQMSQDGRGIGLSITAASAAKFLLTPASAPEFIGTMPSISN